MAVDEHRRAAKGLDDRVGDFIDLEEYQRTARRSRVTPRSAVDSRLVVAGLDCDLRLIAFEQRETDAIAFADLDGRP